MNGVWKPFGPPSVFVTFGRYRVDVGAGFGFVVNGALAPTPPVTPVAVMVYVIAAVGEVVNCTVADPLAFVVDDGDANEPLPTGLADQLTTRPAAGSGAPL